MFSKKLILKKSRPLEFVLRGLLDFQDLARHCISLDVLQTHVQSFFSRRPILLFEPGVEKRVETRD